MPNGPVQMGASSVYDYKGTPADVSAALLDATMQSIDCVSDPERYHALLQETLQQAYDRLKLFEE